MNTTNEPTRPWASARSLAAGRLIALASSFVSVFGLAAMAYGAGEYLKVDYPASTVTNELQIAVTYTLWMPEGVKSLRGVIVHQHGAGTTASIEGSTAPSDLHWQALARKWDCALFGSSYHVPNDRTDLTPGGSEHWFDPRRGSEKTFLKALGEFAARSGHPELETVPWALWGHSGGGIWSDVMTTLHPDRVVAVWLRSGSAAMFRTRAEFPQPRVPTAAYAVPAMCNCGVKEKEKPAWVGPVATFLEYRAQGAPIGFAPDPRTGHECGDSRYLAIPFLDACLAMRLPDKGSLTQALKPVGMSQAWLAPVLGHEVVPAAEYKGDPKEAVWLPNAAVAKAWVEYVQTGAVSDTTPPPAPVNVRVSPQGDQGTEVFWDAEADFESGLAGFIVLRDGQELARVPEKPVGRFGRPLFQSMTFHDTPSQPMPAMRFLDASVRSGEKHTYAVIALNSVGLKSEPVAGTAVGASDEPWLGPYNGPTRAEVDATTLDGKVLCGYQGWFNAPGDGTEFGFGHWGNGFGRADGGRFVVDMWPDVSDYAPQDLAAVPGLKMPDGSPARLYSAFRKGPVLLHCQWAREYGIDGLFLSRFVGETASPERARHVNTVLASVREGCHREGRVWAMMLDLSMGSDGTTRMVMNDWKFLCDKVRIREDSRYLHHQKKPVVLLWGLGFKDRPWTPEQGEELVRFFKSDPQYGGAYLIGGIDPHWRTLGGESRTNAAWSKVYRMFDAISPWDAGRYRDDASMDEIRKTVWEGDLAELKSLGIGYMPTAFPGFSWDNLRRTEPGKTLIARRKGEFYWRQFAIFRALGIRTVFVGMFDEVNEGTAIYKVSNQVPVGRYFVTYEGLPSDWYLKLTGAAARMIRGETLLSEKIPLRLPPPKQ
jgi:hypothetical protein